MIIIVSRRFVAFTFLPRTGQRVKGFRSTFLASGSWQHGYGSGHLQKKLPASAGSIRGDAMASVVSLVLI